MVDENEARKLLIENGMTLSEIGKLHTRGYSIDEIYSAAKGILDRGETLSSSLLFTCFAISAADVVPGQRSFLRYPDLPRGEVVIIAGMGGIGKGQFGSYLMACLSVGADIRTGRLTHNPCNSLFISTEDTSADIRTRLDRADVDADLHKIFIVDKLASYDMGLTVSDDSGLQKIEKLIVDSQAKFTILDPLQGLCGRDIDMSRTNHIRQIMHGLAAIAERTQSVICLFAHPNKRQTIISANDLISGSTDIVSAARSVLLLMPDFETNDPETRLVIHTKSNHCRPGQTIRFQIADSNRVVGLSEVTAADAVEAINFRKLSKAKAQGSRANYEEQFINGINTILSTRNPVQISYREFIEKYAPGFPGKPKVLLDDLTVRLLGDGITVRTTSGKSEIRVNGERGFRCEWSQQTIADPN